MRKISFAVSLMCLGFGLKAQTAVTIQQLQNVSAANLAACVDSSMYSGQAVTVRGVVVTSYGLAVNGSGSTQLRNVWIQSGSGAWSGLDVFDSASADIDGLQAGDSVEITGSVLEFATTAPAKSETELTTITSLSVLGSGRPTYFTTINLSDLNDGTQVNKLATGEQWEGVPVELNNVTVTAVSYFSNNTRVSFTVQDANGNKLNVSDRFKAAKLPAAGGTFVPPTVGTVYCSLKGVITHSGNGCKNANGRGYELMPFDAAHYQVCQGQAFPQISGIARSVVTPSSSQSETVSATITDADGTVTGAKLYWGVGATATTYPNMVAMTASGSNWSAMIPAQADGTFVRYYIEATDNDNHVTASPGVPSSNPLCYVVRDNGTQIYDVQYTPFTNGNSIYLDQVVTLTGVVTASAEPNNLGFVFIQQEGGLLGWGGIMCVGSTQLATLMVGDKVTITGTIKEDFGATRLDNITTVSKIGTGTITPIVVDPSVFSLYDFAGNESYESMLVTLAKSNSKIYVVEENSDAPSNFAEYRLGSDVNAPTTGSRVLAGRQTSSAFGSLNVSYVNDSSWATNAGVMNVPVKVVKYGDCMNSATGIMYYSFSNMKLLPRNNADFDMYDALCDNIPDAKELAVASNLVAYPVPASNVLNVRFAFASAVNTSAELMDMMGRVVATQAINGNEGEVSFNTESVAAGTYTLRVAGSQVRVAIVK